MATQPTPAATRQQLDRIIRAEKRSQTKAGIPKSEQMPAEQLEFLAQVEMIDHLRHPELHKVVKHRKVDKNTFAGGQDSKTDAEWHARHTNTKIA